MILTELRYIVAVARERHFGRAAEACFVSQRRLSVSIKKLEEALDVKIFERGASEVSVTSLGDEIVRQAIEHVPQMPLLLQENFIAKLPQNAAHRRARLRHHGRAFPRCSAQAAPARQAQEHQHRRAEERDPAAARRRPLLSRAAGSRATRRSRRCAMRSARARWPARGACRDAQVES